MKFLPSFSHPFAGAAALALSLLSTPEAWAEKLKVVTTFAPITSMTKNVAGDAAEVEQLLPPGAEPHGFAFAPSDLRKLAKADVVVENGAGFEDWLGKAIKGSQAYRIDTGKGIRLERGNPHIWLDPTLAIRQVEAIRKGLGERDPANAATYDRNAAAYTEKLKQLDGEIRAAAGALADKRLLTVHDAFRYFAQQYGFTVVGVVREFPGQDPTPKAIKRLKDTIEKQQVKVLFTEPQQSPAIVRSLSKELGLPIVEIDPMELGEPTAAMYEKVMRSNLQRLKEALSGGH